VKQVKPQETKEIIDALMFNAEAISNVKWEHALSNTQNLRNALFTLDRITMLTTEVVAQIRQQIATLND
jgi:hypothetical protein